MYGWSGGLGTIGPQLDTGYPVAGVDYDPALLGGATVFPQEDIGPIGWPAYQSSPLLASPAAPQSATQWLNQNAGKVALGVGGFFILTLLAKGGR